MIQTWAADVTPLLDEQIFRKYYDRLPKWRREKADRLKGLRRAQSVGAWVLYQSMRQFYGISGEAVYNLSHSGKYAMCAVDAGKDGGEEDLQRYGSGEAAEEGTATKLGCDVEMIKGIRPGVAKRFFCPAEEAYIMSRETERSRVEEFYRYWVLKESFIKAVRKGLSLELNSFEIQIENGKPLLIRQPEEYPEKYYYKEYTLEARDAKCAVCSTDPEFGELYAASFRLLPEQLPGIL